jgi:hypothetical protein
MNTLQETKLIGKAFLIMVGGVAALMWIAYLILV